MEVAQEFLRIFQGCERGHGEYVITGGKGAKATGKAVTKQTPADESHWLAHLVGRVGLGVIPITEKGTCTWGAVDVDVYEGLDIEDWSIKLPHPLVLFRSKSGGAHVYLFTKVPVPAQLMRKKLALVARAIGHANAEIFPKQDRLDENGIGNWINMPYFGAENTTRYCLKAGVPLSIDDFLYHVEQSSLTLQQLVSFQIDNIWEGDEDPEFASAPPCLRYLVKHGFPRGTLNTSLFSMGVFAKRKFPVGWQEKVAEYNLRFMGPGSYQEVQQVIKSLDKKVYMYKCKDQPCLAYCDRDKCAEAEFGIPREEPKEREDRSKRPNLLDEVTKCVLYIPPEGIQDPPYWVFTFQNNKSMIVTSEAANSQPIFRKLYTSVCHKVFLNINDKKWTESMNKILESAEQITLSMDSGPEGQMFVHLKDFCNGTNNALAQDELILGKVWYNEGKSYFRLQDFTSYLSYVNFRGMTPSEIAKALVTSGAEYHVFTIKGLECHCWSIESKNIENDSFDSRGEMDSEKY